MEHRRLAILVFLFSMLFSISLVAADLFDLEGGTEEPEKEEVLEKKEEKKEVTDAPKTAQLSVKEVSADPEAEKELRELTIKEKDKIKVVQKKDFAKDGRFELGGGVGYLSGDWHSVATADAYMAYHITEYFGVVGKGFFGFGEFKNDTYVQAKDELNADVSTSNLKVAGGLAAQVTPFYGKLSFLGNMIIKYDVSGNVGGFFYQVDQDGKTENNIAGNLGLTGRVFLSNNFTLNLMWDWFLMKDQRMKGGAAGSKVSYLKTDMIFSLNIGMFLPFAD